MEEFQRKRAIREFRDYGQWIKGNFVPTDSKLRTMMESGFSFPQDVKTLDKPMDVASPEDYFQSDSYEGYEAAKLHIRKLVESIAKEPDHDLEVVHIDNEEDGEIFIPI